MSEQSETQQARLALAQKRLQSILARQVVALARTLEQKIADAGPSDQRIEPHILTKARNALQEADVIRQSLYKGRGPWYQLSTADPRDVERKLALLDPIHAGICKNEFTLRLGQTLEIAVFKALRQQKHLFFGAFPDLDQHNDSTLYKKDEPPTSVSGLTIPDGVLDFLVLAGDAGPLALEVKNVREWFYPDREEIRALLRKSCAVNAVPVFIARRIPFITFRLLNAAGVIIHQTYNQFYPNASVALAKKAAHKDLLGFHDIRLGNEPDARLLKFITLNLPAVAVASRKRFEQFKDLLSDYGNQVIPYPVFAKQLVARAGLV